MGLITRNVTAKDVGLPKWAKDAIKKFNLDADTVSLVRKGINPEDTKFNDGERSSVDYITTKTVDRDGEIVLPSGAMLDHYRKNPVVLFGHDYKSLPIGKSLWIKTNDQGLISKTQYAKHEKANDIYNYRKEGFPMAKSIGFIPIELFEEKDFNKIDFEKCGVKKEDLVGASRVYTKWLLLEYSDVPVPSNPDALQLAISKGILTTDDVKKAVANNEYVIEIIETKNTVTKPETTDNYHHIPVLDSGSFVDDSFKTITLSASQGIKAVIGRLKSDPDGPTKIQKYLFDTAKWTLEEAQTWVNEHKNLEIDEIKVLLDDEIKSKQIEKRYGIVAEQKQDSPDPVDDKQKVITKGTVNVINKMEGYKIPKLLLFKRVPIPDSDGPWNETLKNFDIDNFDAEPSTAEYELISKWLDCEIRDIFVHSTSFPSVMMGTLLSGLEETLAQFELVTLRNFRSNGSESPPIYEVIQLTSELSNDFLVNGMEFYEKEESRIIVKREPCWWGLHVTVYSSFKNKDVSIKVFHDTYEWADENNLLKGESFSLGGEFIKKTDDNWNSLFLTKYNESTIVRTVNLINEKGAELPNRGVILTGPPGTGKTLCGRIIRNNTKATFIWMSSRDFVYSGSVGGLGYGFDLARKLSPSVLFIEDIDNWLYDKACDLMKTEMDGLSKSKGVVTILTSNYPEKLPPALIDRPGRFHDILNFNLPDVSTRARMLNAWAAGIHEKTINDMVKDTAGFSGAHMYELVAFAKILADEAGCTIDDALYLSLEKIRDQRSLISDLRKHLIIYDDIANEETAIETKLVNIVEDKSGKVLSKKTRQIITEALDNMEKAITALNEFIKSVDGDEGVIEIINNTEDSKDLDDSVVINKDVTKDKIFIEVDECNLRNAIASSLSDILRSKTKELGNIVNERFDLAKGKVF